VLAEQLLQQYRRDTGAEQETEEDFHERRTSARRKFVCWQLVAEYDGWSLPSQQDFRLHLCQDISAGGISFLADERPRNDQLIIALGTIPFIFFHLRVVRVGRRTDLPDEPYQVGCRFVRRVMGSSE
jgi:hypothetical protein